MFVVSYKEDLHYIVVKKLCWVQIRTVVNA